MLSYKISKKHIRLIRSAITSVYICLTVAVYAQEVENAQSALIDVPVEAPLADTTTEAPLVQS